MCASVVEATIHISPSLRCELKVVIKIRDDVRPTKIDDIKMI